MALAVTPRMAPDAVRMARLMSPGSRAALCDLESKDGIQQCRRFVQPGLSSRLPESFRKAKWRSQQMWCARRPKGLVSLRVR
jgi:hypothetical protein